MYHTNSDRVSVLVEKRYRELFREDLDQGFCDQLIQLYLHPEAFDAKDFKGYDLKTILQYLRITHNYYLDSRLPEIEQTIGQLTLSNAPTPLVKRVVLFFSAYRTKLHQHIEKEEKGILNHVENVLRGENGDKTIVEDFLKEHDDIDSILTYVNELLSTEYLEQNMSLISLLSAQIELLMIDLYIHGRVEEEVFIPKVLNYFTEK